MRYNGNPNLHHVQIKAVRRILGCKGGLRVVHGVTGGLEKGMARESGVKEREGQQEKKMSEEEDIRDEVEGREGRERKERG